MSGDLEQMAIARLKEAARMSESHYNATLIITYSGGKDSSVLLELARRSGIAFEVAHNHTTVDAPDTVYFVRETFKRLEGDGIKCTVNFPYYKGQRATMWSLIPAKGMPPTRIMRYCCDVLKERNNAKRYIATGVRWAESRTRKTRGVYESVHADPAKRVVLFHDNDERRRLTEICAMRRRVCCNPIIDWTDADVWDYINAERIPVNPLYCKGFSRVGCIGCPMARLKMRTFEFALFPTYKAAYIRAFGKMLERRRERGKLDDKWRIGDTGEAVFHWWMEDGILTGQTDLWGGRDAVTNFVHYTASPALLDELLYAVTDDALSARGCSARLKLPPREFPDWESWLESEYVDGLPPAPLFAEPQNETAEQYNARIVTDRLEEIKDAIGRVQTPFAQALCDIFDETIEGVADALERLGGAT